MPLRVIISGAIQILVNVSFGLGSGSDNNLLPLGSSHDQQLWLCFVFMMVLSPPSLIALMLWINVAHSDKFVLSLLVFS